VRVFDGREFVRQLTEGDLRIDHHWLHGGNRSQRFVQPHGIEDPKRLFADVGAQPRRAPEHLIEQNAATYPAQKDNIANLGNVDARR